MHEFFASYLERLQTLHSAIEEALEGLPAEALDWVPGPQMNSFSVLVAHLSGAQRYWIGDVAGQDPSRRVREHEFEVVGWDVAQLEERLAATLHHSRTALQQLSLDDLSAPRLAPRDNNTYSVAWALNHALEHTALHVGHIEILRQLWDQRPEAAL